jgi:hypothetical protein
MDVCTARSVSMSRAVDTSSAWKRLKSAFILAFRLKSDESWRRRAAVRAEVAELARRRDIILETDDPGSLPPLTKSVVENPCFVRIDCVTGGRVPLLVRAGKGTSNFTRPLTCAGASGCATIHCSPNPSESNGNYCPAHTPHMVRRRSFGRLAINFWCSDVASSACPCIRVSAGEPGHVHCVF